MAKELDEELFEEDEFDTEEENEEMEEDSVEESTELTPFELCIKDYLDNFGDVFFKSIYKPEDIKNCCKYILNEVQKTKRNAFCDEEIFKMARDYYVDKKEAPKDSAKPKKIIIPTTKKEEKSEEQQLSLFDF